MATFHLTAFTAIRLILGLAAPLCLTLASEPAAAAQTYRYVAPSPQLKALHKKLIRQKTLPSNQLRILADSGNRLAAFLLARTLENDGAAPLEAIHYYTIAIYYGQASAADPLVSLIRLYHSQLDPRRLELAQVALKRAAQRNYNSAATELARFYLTGTPFGLKIDEAMAILAAAAKKGNSEAAFLGATVLMASPMNESQKTEAKGMLTIAASAGNIMAQSLLEELAVDSANLKSDGTSQ
jgi:TPR repeat protein